MNTVASDWQTLQPFFLSGYLPNHQNSKGLACLSSGFDNRACSLLSLSLHLASLHLKDPTLPERVSRTVEALPLFHVVCRCKLGV